MSYVIPIRRKPAPGDSNYIRFSHEANSWQRKAHLGHWYNITPVIARVLREQGFKLWDLEHIGVKHANVDQ